MRTLDREFIVSYKIVKSGQQIATKFWCKFDVMQCAMILSGTIRYDMMWYELSVWMNEATSILNKSVFIRGTG